MLSRFVSITLVFHWFKGVKPMFCHSCWRLLLTYKLPYKVSIWATPRRPESVSHVQHCFSNSKLLEMFFLILTMWFCNITAIVLQHKHMLRAIVTWGPQRYIQATSAWWAEGLWKNVGIWCQGNENRFRSPESGQSHAQPPPMTSLSHQSNCRSGQTAVLPLPCQSRDAMRPRKT